MRISALPPYLALLRLSRTVHDYYPFPMEDGAGWRLWRLSWSIAWHFCGHFVACLACMGATDSRSSRFDSYVRMRHFVRRSTYLPFRRFLGMFGENSWNVFLLLCIALWVRIFAMLCKRAVLMV
jgi:hypothetical protein